MKFNLFSRELLTQYHTLLIGASPLIPLPFLDEMVAAYLKRHLAAEIAKSYNVKLSRTEIRQLTGQQGMSCLGIVGFIIIRPIEEFFREIFFWLEWKRGIDLATQAYYFGYLLNVIFERGKFNPQDSARYWLAIQRSLKGVNTKLVRNMIGKTFYSSKGLVWGVTGWLFQFAKYYLWRRPAQLLVRFRRKKSSQGTALDQPDHELNDFLKDAQPRIKDLITTLLESLSRGIGSLPKEHFDDLTSRLVFELQREPEESK